MLLLTKEDYQLAYTQTQEVFVLTGRTVNVSKYF